MNDFPFSIARRRPAAAGRGAWAQRLPAGALVAGALWWGFAWWDARQRAGLIGGHSMLAGQCSQRRLRTKR